MNALKVFLAFFISILAGVGIIAATKPKYQPDERAFYLKDAEATFLRQGLNLVIQKVELAPPIVSVTFPVR